MRSTEPAETGLILHVEGLRARPGEAIRRTAGPDEVVHPWSYHAKLGRGVLRVGPVEYRILQFLAANPYHAYTPRRIAEAVTTENLPVTEETLSEYVASLREQLGFYGNYIQSVPFIGYRFKA